jgi:hypothetical protein
MTGKFELSELLKKYPVDDLVKDNIARLFEYTQYLFDNDENLTKTMNLTKTAKESLIERIEEMFEGAISEEESSADSNFNNNSQDKEE